MQPSANNGIEWNKYITEYKNFNLTLSFAKPQWVAAILLLTNNNIIITVEMERISSLHITQSIERYYRMNMNKPENKQNKTIKK